MGASGFQTELPVYVVVKTVMSENRDQPLGSFWLNFFQSMLSMIRTDPTAAGEEDRPYVLVVEGPLQVTGTVFGAVPRTAGRPWPGSYRPAPQSPGLEDDGGTHLPLYSLFAVATMATVSPA